MAMARSLAHLLFFVVASTALAARDLPDATSNLEEACDETQFPDLCVRSLTAFQDSRTASPRRMAELSVLAALDTGRDAATFAHDALNSVADDDGDLLSCLDSCSADVEEAVARLSALSREPTDAKFLEVKSWLSATLGAAAPYEAVCEDAPDSLVKDAAIAKSVEFDMMLRVTLDLITEASGSMSAEVVALDAASSPAYGAPYGSPAYGAGAPYGAPSYGAPSYGGRMPLAPAPAPSKGYGHRRPRAPAPSPSRGYGARMPLPRAPAPAPFRGYGHRRPRPRPHPHPPHPHPHPHPHPRPPVPSRKPRAPAPSPSGGYGAGMPLPRAPAPTPSRGYGHRRPRPHPHPHPRAPVPSRKPRAPAPSPSYGARRPRAPAPSPFGSYGSSRRQRAPAPSPFAAYGARRPGAPAPSRGVSRPPAPSTYFSILNTDETA